MSKFNIKSNKIFLLGSGFSNAINPLMPTLFGLKTIIENKFLTNSEKSLIEFYKSIPEEIKINIEYLLTYLSTDMPWKKPSQNYSKKALFTELVKYIQQEFVGLETTKEEAEKNIPSIKALLKFIHQQGSPVLTFNYDYLFEKLFSEYEKRKIISIQGDLKESGINFKYDFNVVLLSKYSKKYEFVEKTKFKLDLKNQFITNLQGEIYLDGDVNVSPEELCEGFKGFQEFIEINDRTINIFTSEVLKNLAGKAQENQILYTHLYQAPLQDLRQRSGHSLYMPKSYTEVHLLKLHGSINWFYSGTDDFTSEQIFQSHPQDFPKNLSTYDLVPYIIPPLLDKSAFYSHGLIKNMWFNAGEYIRNAEDMYFIGYSIPSTDLSVKYLIADNIKKGANVYVVNKVADKKSAEKLKNTYIEALPGVNLIFDYLCVGENAVEKFIQEYIS